jgi:hemolysin activation/secretion protein
MEKGDNGSASITTAFPFTTGAVLNLRDIEQGLDQINRLPSNNAVMDIRPGAKVGESVIVIKNQPSKRWHVSTTADDYGDRTTGRNQLGATLSLDDILGLNESYSLTQRKTLPFNHDTKQSSSTSGTISVPFGYTTATVGYSGSDYDSTLNTPGGLALHLNGTNRNLFVTLDHVWYRDQNGKATVSATLTRKSANNYIAAQKLGVSSRTLTILDLPSSYTTALLGGSANVSGTYSRGLRLLGGLKDADDLPGQSPHAQFDKFAVSAGWLKPFEVAKENLSFSTQFTGQYALNPLYGSEQISVGGIYSVRGFYRETLANDNGYFVRNDLTLRHRLNDTLAYQPVTLSPYLALDFGSVGSGKVAGTAHGTLVGAAIGLGVTVGPVSFDVYGGRPVTAPKAIMDGEGYNTFARLAVNF